MRTKTTLASNVPRTAQMQTAFKVIKRTDLAPVARDSAMEALGQSTWVTDSA